MSDLLVTDLAPTDLLLQRLGRLHRHRRNDLTRPTECNRPRVIILDPLTGDEATAREIRECPEATQFCLSVLCLG